MNCQKCGCEMREKKAEYCPKCGGKLEFKKNCLNCFWLNNIDNKFCIKCGKSFEEIEIKIIKILSDESGKSR